MSFLASPARFERAAFRLGGERSILLSYGDRYSIFAAAQNARQKELYRSAGGIVNQSGDEFRAARGNLLPLRPIGAAVRRMVKLR